MIEGENFVIITRVVPIYHSAKKAFVSRSAREEFINTQGGKYCWKLEAERDLLRISGWRENRGWGRVRWFKRTKGGYNIGGMWTYYMQDCGKMKVGRKEVCKNEAIIIMWTKVYKDKLRGEEHEFKFVMVCNCF